MTSGASRSTTTCSPGVADDLIAKGLARISDGALCAFPEGFTNRDGTPLPVIIRKSDGGYNYSTTDLATVRYRVDKVNVDRAIYVVGSDQALHFRMVFAVAREAGWLPADKRLRARPDRHGPGQGRPPAADPGRRQRQAQRPAHRGGRSGPARSSTRSSATTRASTSTRSRRTSASARSSTPTCRPRGTARTSSTGTG